MAATDHSIGGAEGILVHPATDVNWEDVRAYARWSSRKIGEDRRPSSESEWGT